ncbi:hypothetical protein [Croceicoccus hydrothermalis]|uniref:hypothetical protein n=1 Tax=Croceicoccus hydrothermalis TaxID=2867964 RepID=UPI001EFB8D82|nr:hypothetical protein [Croceicoccus hydrothermalis]
MAMAQAWNRMVRLGSYKYGGSEAVWRGAHPALWIAIFVGLIAFAWEMFQLPFYSTGELGPAEVAYRCGLASFGDAGIMVAAYLGASLENGRAPWIVQWPISRLLVYLAIGLGVTSAVELLAVGADWGWTYSSLMPLLPGTKIGLVPIIMWVIVPSATLWLARRMGVGPG